jgi:hypothetical protein
MSNFLSVLPSRLVSHVRKLIILMISLASLLLVTPFATAGLAEDIKADVKSIKNLVKDTKPLASNASKGVSKLTADDGLLDMVDDVNTAKLALDPQMLDDLISELPEKLELLKVFKNYRVRMMDSEPTDVPRLVGVLKQAVSLLKNAPPGATPEDFLLLDQLILDGPPELIDFTGRALQTAKLDEDFILKLEELVTTLKLVREVEGLEETEQAREFAPLSETGGNARPGLQGGTQCETINENRRRLKIAAGFLSVTGVGAVVTGDIMAGLAKTVVTNAQVAVWGWAGGEVKTHPLGAVGQVTAGLGKGVLAKAGSVYGKLRHCELLWHQERNFELQQDVLEEVCTLTRFRSETCQALSN